MESFKVQIFSCKI